MDEAMHPLTLLCFGLYGEVLPNQNGAPLRLVIPWKYGFKSIKSIVRIRFVEKQPPTTWNKQSSGEYGFYSNVNPAVNHPRWSQATEHRLRTHDARSHKAAERNGGSCDLHDVLRRGINRRGHANAIAGGWACAPDRQHAEFFGQMPDDRIVRTG